MVAENIVAEAGVSVVQAAPKDEEFSEFVSSVKASDFKVAGKVELPPDEEE
jgi:hypothetical protein